MRVVTIIHSERSKVGDWRGVVVCYSRRSMASNYQDDFMSLYLNIKMITGHREHHAPVGASRQASAVIVNLNPHADAPNADEQSPAPLIQKTKAAPTATIRRFI